jgi:hypothetical protein
MVDGHPHVLIADVLVVSNQRQRTLVQVDQPVFNSAAPGTRGLLVLLPLEAPQVSTPRVHSQIRNPCYDLGDVAVLPAVDVPELHDLVDVVVLSTQGDRPQADELSGGALREAAGSQEVLRRDGASVRGGTTAEQRRQAS